MTLINIKCGPDIHLRGLTMRFEDSGDLNIHNRIRVLDQSEF